MGNTSFWLSTKNRLFSGVFLLFSVLLIGAFLLLIFLYTSNLSVGTYWSVVGWSPLVYFDFFLFPFFFVFILITPLTLIYAFKYRSDELFYFTLFVANISVIGFGLFFVNSLLIFFLLYESLLIPSFLILYFFAKTRKAVEASFLMFFWTQFGAIFLIIGFQYIFVISSSLFFNEFAVLTLSSAESNFLFFLLLFGFGVKFPIWPFYDWLPQAHVEASTNFSIFLSGVLVKFAFFGFIKFLFILNIAIVPLWVYPFLLIGFLDSSTKLYYQTDFKKVIAYSTVIEMHWLTLAILQGGSFFWLGSFAMLISHAFLSSNFFIIIDSVTRRFKTRVVSEVSGLAFQTPNLYFVTLSSLVVFLGFPGSLFFLAEVLFFSALLDFNLVIFIFFFFIAYFVVPSCFFKSWFLLLFGSSTLTSVKCTDDMSTFENLFLWFFLFMLFILGYSFQVFF